MKALSEKDRSAILAERQAWRNVFNSPSGQIVFRRLAKECYFYNDDIAPDDYEAIGKNNYFKTIIERLGCANDADLTTDTVADAMLDALLKLPLSVKETEEEEEEET